MMTRCQMSSNASPICIPSQQLARSKSLNDISNDNLISAFASDRFINLPNPNNIGNNPPTNGKDPVIACMPNNSYSIYNQTSNDVNIIQNVFNSNNNNNNNINMYGNLSFDNSRNLNSNQCSRPANANVFNLCNPLATLTLNGVTEQIGNLHL